MVWSCVTANEIGPLHRCSNRMNAVEYKEILQSELLPFKEHSAATVFQQDCAPVHTARIVKTWMEENDLPVLPWVPQSPDLNPIEWLWHELEKRLRARPSLPTNLPDLWNILVDEWGKLTAADVRKIVATMPTRVREVLKVNGNATKY